MRRNNRFSDKRVMEGIAGLALSLTGLASKREAAMTRTPATELSPEESWLFLAELSHRINNEYAAAISMLSAAAARTTSEEARSALKDASARLHDCARVHRALRMPSEGTLVEACDCIREVCQSITQSRLRSRGIVLTLVEHPFEMDAERCWRLCLILSELITNAARHAFCTTGGSIRVEVLPSPSTIECRVSDSGYAHKPVRPGRGLKIIEALAGTLGGKAECCFGEGSAVVVTFPRDSDGAILPAAPASSHAVADFAPIQVGLRRCAS
jgi:two-component sensor histidine kinase